MDDIKQWICNKCCYIASFKQRLKRVQNDTRKAEPKEDYSSNINFCFGLIFYL